MPQRLNCYLTRRANGLYLLTYGPPVIANVGNTERQDAYPAPGDAIAFNNICEWAAKLIWRIGACVVWRSD
jgi:hypothetical protein